jgi:5'-deoxynucleotidase YfbR-like HD superfamily hydrolase
MTADDDSLRAEYRQLLDQASLRDFFRRISHDVTRVTQNAQLAAYLLDVIYKQGQPITEKDYRALMEALKPLSTDIGNVLNAGLRAIDDASERQSE